MVDEYEKLIITYNGTKEDFDKNYYSKLKNDNCSISLYIDADDKTLVFLDCKKNNINDLEKKINSFEDENIILEKDKKITSL